MTRTLVLLPILVACASSSAPFVTDHDDTRLVSVPASAYPDEAGESRTTQLVARGDHALVTGMGACVGKAIDRCLAGAPLWVRGDEPPRQIDPLRRPTSLLWTELTGGGDVIVHRMPEGGAPSLSRVDETGLVTLGHEVDSNPGLSRAVDGSVLAQTRRGEQSVLLRIDGEGEEELARGASFVVESRDDATYVQVRDELSELLVVHEDGETMRWFAGATVLRSLTAGDRHLFCADSTERSELLEPATGERVSLRGTCLETRAGPGVVWNEAEVWAWSDTPVRVTSEVSGNPQLVSTPDGWVVLDATGLRWFDRIGYEVRRELLEVAGSLHAHENMIAVTWNDDSSRARARMFGDGLDEEIALPEGMRLVTASLDEGVLWMSASRGGDDYLPLPATDVFRVDGSTIIPMLERASDVVLYGSLLAANGSLFRLGRDMEHLLDIDGPLLRQAPGLYVYSLDGENVLARWADSELTELARATDRFELVGDLLRWQHEDGWHIARLIDGELSGAYEGLDQAHGIGADLVSIRRDDLQQVCSTDQCWTVPNGMQVIDAQLTETGRFFGLLRDGDADVLWYSRL